MNIATTISEITTLSVEDRLRIVQAIVESIEAEQPDPELSEAWKKEINRRLAAYEANPNDVLTWEEIKSYVRRPR